MESTCLGDGKMPRNAAITVRMEIAVKEALVALAKEDGRSDSQYLERLIIAHLKKMGRLPKTGN
jgi:predicted DNA-binding protein